jgi:hypothetical protein
MMMKVGGSISGQNLLYLWPIVDQFLCPILDQFIFQGCLKSITIRYGKESVEDKSDLSESKLQRIWHYVGDAPGWLARVVRPIANLNLWIHTRSAFCP